MYIYFMKNELIQIKIDSIKNVDTIFTRVLKRCELLNNTESQRWK